MPKPMFAEGDSETMTIAWPAVDETRSAEILSYIVYVSANNASSAFFNHSYEVDANNASWPLRTTPEQPVPVPMATFVHNCQATAHQLPNGSVILEDRRSHYIYVRVATRTRASLGELSETATMFCAARPKAPVV